ncbi:hypothetical protein KC316_g3 [Hortaea werneckii]|nr:hypothetical protein KC316_g3 [Hortaea werneckii]
MSAICRRPGTAILVDMPPNYLRSQSCKIKEERGRRRRNREKEIAPHAANTSMYSTSFSCPCLFVRPSVYYLAGQSWSLRAVIRFTPSALICTVTTRQRRCFFSCLFFSQFPVQQRMSSSHRWCGHSGMKSDFYSRTVVVDCQFGIHSHGKASRQDGLEKWRVIIGDIITLSYRFIISKASCTIRSVRNKGYMLRRDRDDDFERPLGERKAEFDAGLAEPPEWLGPSKEPTTTHSNTQPRDPLRSIRRGEYNRRSAPLVDQVTNSWRNEEKASAYYISAAEDEGHELRFS